MERKTYTQTDTHTHTHTHTHTDIHMHTNKQRDIQRTDIEARRPRKRQRFDGQTDKKIQTVLADRWTETKTDNRWKDGRTGRQKDTQTG